MVKHTPTLEPQRLSFQRYEGSSARAKRGDKSETAMPWHDGEPEADKESLLSGVQSSDALSYVSCLDDSLSDVCCLGDDDNSMCTCGAEGRAHKRRCPMNSCYPGRTLFPRIDVSEGSPVASACGDVLESVVSRSDNFKPLPPKRRKIQVEIGDYVGIHSKTMGESHVPCHVVGEFGDRFQLYCSKGVLNVSFSSSELIPLTTCASIPLDKWRQAPKVSLRSLTRDPAIAEHCDCNLTLCSESIVVSLTFEAVDTEHNMWVKNHVYSLTHHDR